MDQKLEVFVIPVRDEDRSIQFYAGLDWRQDADIAHGEDYRVVQFTPPGSVCSIIFGKGVSKAEPGSYQDMTLVVRDIETARKDLESKGAPVSEIFHGTIFGNTGRVPGLDLERKSYSSLVSFKDPEGNGWLVQEITERLPG